jgi:hypothetical protein
MGKGVMIRQRSEPKVEGGWATVRQGERKRYHRHEEREEKMLPDESLEMRGFLDQLRQRPLSLLMGI